MKLLYILLCGFIFLPLQVEAGANSTRVYQQSIFLASQGKVLESIAALQAASAVLSKEDIWRERMLAASVLLTMQKKQGSQLSVTEQNNYLKLATAYIKAQPQLEVDLAWPVGLLAAILPGAGHAWQGRWRDAGVAALFVWPLLILTLWAAHRGMGPVTVFFALLTVWLWSGTVFSAISLMERGSFEVYIQWWQQLWQASALPGRPW